MKSLSLLAFCLLSLVAFGPDVSAQVTPVPAGCTVPNGGTATAPIANGAPMIGNLSFAVEHRCPAGSTAALWLIGNCAPPPLTTYPPLCGMNCTAAVTNVSFNGALIPPTPTSVGLPLPNVALLQGLTFCMQFICFDIGSGACFEVSQGLSVTIQ